MRADLRTERIGQHTAGTYGLRRVTDSAVPPDRIRPPGPPPFRVVQRPRLLDLISRGVREAPLTLVSAGAGSGKTVLTAAWARHHRQSPVAWLSLSDRDDTFIPDVCSALAGAGVLDADDPHLTDVEALSAHLLLLDEPVVLVLDAADRVRRQVVFEQLGRLLDAAGDRLRVLMTTRADPPLPLHRLRLEGTVSEIRYDDLAFTAAEVGALVGVHDIEAPEAVQEVFERTEGWAAGVRLAALALWAGDHHTLPTGFAADYLAAEVFADLDREDRDFLLRISLVDELPAELAAALAARPDADTVLRRMAIGNTFVQPVRGHYRIHGLFREFLRAELARTLPGAIDDLRRRAADWYGANGRLVQAVNHAAETGDWERAAGFVVNGLGVGDLLLRTGVGTELARGLSDMPAVDSVDVQLVRAAIAVANDDVTAARQLLADCAVDHPVSGDWSASAAAVTTLLYDKSGSVDQTLLAARAQREELAAHGNAVLNALVLGAEGKAHLRGGDLDVACAVLTDAVRTAATGDCADLRLLCLATLALAEACRGHLSRAQGLADTAERLAADTVTAAERPAATHLAHAWVALERQDLAGAQQSLDRARRLRETHSDHLFSSVFSLLSVRLMRDRGDRIGARGALADPEPPDSWLRRSIDAEAAGVGLDRAGRHDTTERGTITASQQMQELLDRALAEWLDGNVRDGRSAIAKALSLGRAERLRRPFAHTSARIRAIIRNDAALRSLAGWLGADELTAGDPSDGPAPIVEELSERELEVLRLLAALRTTTEIAAELFISVNTVKSHIRNILRKLSVSSRNESVRRAWDLNLI